MGSFLLGKQYTTEAVRQLEIYPVVTSSKTCPSMLQSETWRISGGTNCKSKARFCSFEQSAGDKRKPSLIEEPLYEKKFTIQRFIVFIQPAHLALNT